MMSGSDAGEIAMNSESEFEYLLLPLPLPLPFPLPLPGLAGFPFAAVDTPPDWSLCEPSATTADGAVGFIDDFESLHAAVRPSAVTATTNARA